MSKFQFIFYILYLLLLQFIAITISTLGYKNGILDFSLNGFHWILNFWNYLYNFIFVSNLEIAFANEFRIFFTLIALLPIFYFAYKKPNSSFSIFLFLNFVSNIIYISNSFGFPGKLTFHLLSLIPLISVKEPISKNLLIRNTLIFSFALTLMILPLQGGESTELLRLSLSSIFFLIYPFSLIGSK